MLAVGVADIVGDVGVLVMAERVHGGDAGLVIAGEDHLAGGAVVAEEFLLRQLLLLLLDDAAVFLLLLLFAAVVGVGGLSVPMAKTVTGLMLTAVTSNAAAANMPMVRSAWVGSWWNLSC